MIPVGTVANWRTVSFLVVLAALAAAPLVLSEWIVFLLTIALAKGMVVLGVTLLLRGGLISFGHGLYFAAGGYAVAFAIAGLGTREILVLLPLCILVGAGIAAVIGVILRRYRGIFFAMLSLAASMILYTVLLKFYRTTGGTDGISIPPYLVFGIEPAQEWVRATGYYLTLATTLGVLYVVGRLVYSPLGFLMQAVRYNEIRVEYVGASVPQAIYFTYVFSGAVGGLGGGLVALNVGHVAPELAYWTASADFVFVAVLGGSTSVFAPFAGSIVFEFVKNYAFKLSPQTWQLTLGAILLLIIFFLPQGLWSLRAVLAEKWRKRNSF